MADGVWRTVGGRRVFIKDGEDLETAMKNSGKFEKEHKTMNKKEEYDRLKKQNKTIDYNKERNIEQELRYKQKWGEGLTKEEEEKLKLASKNVKTFETNKERMEELKKELYGSQKNNNNQPKPTGKKETDFTEEFKNKKPNQMPELDKNEIDEIVRGVTHQLQEDYKLGTYVDADVLDYEVENSKMYGKAQMLTKYWDENGIKYDDNYLSDVREKIESKSMVRMENEGFYLEHISGKDKYIISNARGIEKGYNNMVDYLDKKNVSYEISRSTEAGIAPSVYIKDADGDVILRIGNHFNRNSTGKEKTFVSKDYINWEENIKRYIEDEIW